MKTLTIKSAVMSLAHTMTRESFKTNSNFGTYAQVFKTMLKKAWALKKAEVQQMELNETPKSLVEKVSAVSVVETRRVTANNHAEEYNQVLKEIRTLGYFVLDTVSASTIRRAEEGMSFYVGRVQALLEAKSVIKYILSDKSEYYFFKN